MKHLIIFLCLTYLFFSCRPKKNVPDNVIEKPKSELAFLLQYNGRLPDDVGFLTNHIVTRRLANMWKEKTESILKLQTYGDTINVQHNTVGASFTRPDNYIFVIAIDIANDAIVAGYKCDTFCEVKYEREKFWELKGFCP